MGPGTGALDPIEAAAMEDPPLSSWCQPAHSVAQSRTPAQPVAIAREHESSHSDGRPCTPMTGTTIGPQIVPLGSGCWSLAPAGTMCPMSSNCRDVKLGWRRDSPGWKERLKRDMGWQLLVDGEQKVGLGGLQDPFHLDQPVSSRGGLA